MIITEESTATEDSILTEDSGPATEYYSAEDQLDTSNEILIC